MLVEEGQKTLSSAKATRSPRRHPCGYRTLLRPEELGTILFEQGFMLLYDILLPDFFSSKVRFSYHLGGLWPIMGKLRITLSVNCSLAGAPNHCPRDETQDLHSSATQLQEP
jgi:hypothetical protein